MLAFMKASASFRMSIIFNIKILTRTVITTTKARTFPTKTSITKPMFVASIDQGTTSTRCLIFDKSGILCSTHQIPLKQYHPFPGWTEHDPEEIFESAKICLREAVKKLKEQTRENVKLSAVGITNQRETTIAWDRRTGKPLCKAIVWLDMRTTDLVSSVIADLKGDKNKFAGICGLPVSTYFSALKMKWLMENDDSVKRAISTKTLCFGTNLTGGKSYKTDVTNASRYMLMNLKSQKWDQTLLSYFGISNEFLPEICSSSEIYGHVSAMPEFKDVPISGCLGDQQAALVGQMCLEPHSAKNTYGTGCFLLYNTGREAVFSKNGLLTTVAYKLGKSEPTFFALEGSVAVAGAVISWLKSNANLISSVEEFNEIIKKVEDTEGVYFVPAFSGLFAPYWRSDAKGTLVGMNLKTDRSHIVRAAMESICFQNEKLFRCIQDDLSLNHNPCKVLNVDGGVTNSDVCMQFQSDILNMSIKRPAMTECTALGAALAAGLGAGVWSSQDDLRSNLAAKSEATRFNPAMTEASRQHRIKWWNRAIEKSLDWDYHSEPEVSKSVVAEKKKRLSGNDTPSKRFQSEL